VSPSGIGNYESLDDEPVRLVVMIVTAAGQPSKYSNLLAETLSILKRESVREDLTLASAPAQIHSILRKAAVEESDS